MGKKIIFLGLILLFVTSCSLFSNSEETEKIPPFTFHEAQQLDNYSIQSVFISSKGNYYVGTLGGLTVYLPEYGKFGAIGDGSIGGITRLKEFNGRLYGSISNSNIIVSSYDGLNWERELRLHRPIFDFWVTPDSLIVLGSEFGTYVKIPGLQKLTRARFLESLLITDFIVTLSQTENGVLFAGCHDGIYKSVDSGKSWSKTSNEIPKYFDNIKVLFTDKNDRLIAIEEFTFYISEDNGDSWEEKPHSDYKPYNLIQNHDGRFYLFTSNGLYISPPDELSFKPIDLAKYIDKTKTYAISKFYVSHEKIIVSDGASVYFGEINWDSPFWDSW